MPRIVSVSLTEEMWLQFQHQLQVTAAEMGVQKVTASVVLRQLILQWMGNPQPLFPIGWREGYLAAYGEVMRAVQTTLAELSEAPPQPDMLGDPGSLDADQR